MATAFVGTSTLKGKGMFNDLIEKKLVRAKSYDNGLTVYKYERCVFYDNLWNLDSRLLDARGMVLDSQGRKVIWPFTKVFNRFENGTDLPPDTKVVCPVKMNGFMASATRYQDEVLISTTGTLDSSYVELARKYLDKHSDMILGMGIGRRVTFLFEICSPEDPHIIEEQEGAYLIGIRDHVTGEMFPEEGLDHLAETFGVLRPYVIECTFAEIVELNARCEIEGYMVRLADEPGQPIVMKLKSPYYLTTKFLARMGLKKIEQMYKDVNAFKHIIDEEFYAVVDYITANFSKETWIEFKEVDRRDIVQGYFAMCAEYKEG